MLINNFLDVILMPFYVFISCLLDCIEMPYLIQCSSVTLQSRYMNAWLICEAQEIKGKKLYIEMKFQTAEKTSNR